MRCAIALLSAIFFLPNPSSAQNKVDIEDLAHHPLESDFPSGGVLKMRIGAGDLSIGVGNPADYSHVDASVTSGAIEAEPFGESRGGLFRSFEKSGSGKYKLVAHVGAADLTLK